MALSALIVRIGADLTDLNRGLSKADRDVERFGKKIQPLGRSLSRIGTSASMAAGSLSRLGGVMPGVAGGAGAVVRTLGVTSIALGETAVLAAGLTKGMRLLQAASTAIAASSAPAWIASLATPAGLAVAGIVALTAAVGGLTLAWKRFSDQARSGGVKAIEMLDLSGRLMTNDMKSASANRMFAIQDATLALSDANVELSVAKVSLEGIEDVLSGIRPVTGKLIEQWMFARSIIVDALKDTSKFTDAAVSQLYRMLAALKQIAAVVAPLSKSDAAGLINMPRAGVTVSGGDGSRTQRLDPRSFLGNGMDFAPTPMSKWRTFGADVRSGIQPKDAQGNAMNLGQSVGQMLGGGAGGMVQAFAAFGPLAAILPIISGALEALAPLFELLIQPLTMIGQLLGQVLAPIIRGLTVVISYVMEAFGWLVRAIGRLVDALPGVSAKGVINAGQQMIDAAKAARANARATNKATDAVEKFAGALSNVPRVLNINALRHLVGGSGGGGGGGGGGGSPPINPRPRPGFESRAPIIINVYDATDPVRTADVVARELENRLMRGGTNRLGVVFA